MLNKIKAVFGDINMWLKQLIIRNFQQIEFLDVTFSSGVSYIVGPSGGGKSTVIRAIGFLFFNEPHSDDIIRPDKLSDKKRPDPTSVIGVLSNGTEVEHIKSSSINRYKVRKPGEQELVYDSIGVDIPEDVKKILQVSTLSLDKETLILNIANQIELPFLYDKSGSFRLKLFNLITGCDFIDKLLQLMNKNILQYGRDIKTEQEFIATNTPKLNDVTLQVDAKKIVLGNFKKFRSEIIASIERLKTLEQLSDRLEKTKAIIQESEQTINNIQIVPDCVITDLKTNIDHLTVVSGYRASIDALNADLKASNEALASINVIPQETIDNLRKQIDKFITLDDINDAYHATTAEIASYKIDAEKIKFIELDIDSLRTKINKLTAMKDLATRLKIITEQIPVLESDQKNKSETVEQLTKEYQQVLIEAKICPICKQDTTKCEVH